MTKYVPKVGEALSGLTRLNASGLKLTKRFL